MQLQLLPKREIQKIAKAMGDLSGNEFDNKITEVSKTLLQNFEKHS